jgi:hypothetical protein
MEKFDTFRDHFLSLYQSAVSDVASQIESKAAVPARRGLQRSAVSALPEIAASIAAREFAKQRNLAAPNARPLPRELTRVEIGEVCAELAFRYLRACVTNDAAELARVNDEFIAGTCDPAWAGTIKEYIRYFGLNGTRNKIPYIRAAAVGGKVIEIDSESKMAIAGDWGTGADPAIQLLKQIDSVSPDIFIHLGDIYYSGTPLECQKNFVEPISRVLRANGRNPKIYTLSGNHDMYCGGVGYYGLIKELNEERFVQPASFFCLRTSDERWQFLAMDTGLHDYSPANVGDAVTYLEPDELRWHCERIEEFPGKTVLLSHHQLFSAFSAIGPSNGGKRSALNPKLHEDFLKLNASGKVSAWFWGHEHTLSIYEPFADLRRGRCVGHGAVPTSIVDTIYEPLADLEGIPRIKDGTRLANVGGVYAHGFATIALEKEFCRAVYFQDLGGRKDVLFEERFD